MQQARLFFLQQTLGESTGVTSNINSIVNVPLSHDMWKTPVVGIPFVCRGSVFLSRLVVSSPDAQIILCF